MSPYLILGIIAGYFGLLIIISQLTAGRSDNSTFFLANRNSSWYMVAFGMIGASLSGVTFISVPGAVGDGYMSYFQMVLGYFLGYLAIAYILLPLYYKLRLTSIYTYLEQRYGFWSYKTGAFFFLLSRVIGASFRLFLVAVVLDSFVLRSLGIPFWLTVLVTIALIWVYSFRGGIKTIVWTDTLQTLAMLLALGIAIYFISSELGWNGFEFIGESLSSDFGKIFVWDPKAPDFFLKHFLSGAFITIVMTGLDQDMMQKNLTCRSLGDARKNMLWMSVVLIVVNFLFLCLGAMLYVYALQNNIIELNFDDKELMQAGKHISVLNSDGISSYIKKDELFPYLALNQLPLAVGLLFLIGLIAAAYSSADSALTALTTSFCVDFLGMDENSTQLSKRYLVHLGFSVLLFLVILVFWRLNNDSVINELFRAAGYTYGPLLGLYGFGLLTKMKIRDNWVPYVSLAAPVLCYMLNSISEQVLGGYKFGFELLIINGLLTALGLWLISIKPKAETE